MTSGMPDTYPPANTIFSQRALKHFFNRRVWLPLLLALSLAGCSGTPTDKEKNTVSELTTNMQTWGLGRFLVDIPSSWRYGDSETLTLHYGLGKDFEDVEITVIESQATLEAFERTVSERAYSSSQK